jgi:4-hydroxybenzoate polyprenyltransferase
VSVEIARSRATRDRVRGLIVAAHAGPTVAVTVLFGLLAAAEGLGPARGGLVTLAVLCGQLSIGWSNDLIDLRRDRASGRTDKPLVTGAAAASDVRTACGVAVVACVALSLACGLAAGLVHLACVASGWAYNAGLKATVWSWAPYALTFGGMTVFVALAGGQPPPWWWPVGAGLLGVGAHLLNVLPDLADDAETGVRGFPHRLGPRLIAPVAAAVLVGASVVVILGASPPPALALAAAVLVATLAVFVVADAGDRAFAAAVGIALIDAVLLVAAR